MTTERVGMFVRAHVEHSMFDIQIVNQFFMLSLQNVAQKLVVHALAVFELLRGKHGVFELAAKLGFNPADYFFQRGAAGAIRHDQQVGRVVIFFNSGENSRQQNQFHAASQLFEATRQKLAGDGACVNQKRFQLARVRKNIVKRPSRLSQFFQTPRSGRNKLRFFDSLAQKFHAQKRPCLALHFGLWKSQYFCRVGKRKNFIRACEKKAHNFHARAGPEKLVQNLRHYFNSTTAPAASSFCFNSWAAALSIPSFTTFGAASARSFASLSPEPRTSRKTLIT